MKMSRILAAALIAGLSFVPNANATAIDFVSTTAGSLGTGNTGSYTITEAPSMNTTDKLAGTLAENTQVSIKYSYAASTPYLLNATATAAAGSELAQATASTSDVLGTTPVSSSSMSSLPVIVTAGFSTGSQEGTTLIRNLSSSSISFSSIFSAAIFSATAGGSTAVSYNVSAIPLPSTFVLFALGLLILTGFGIYKKARSRM